MAHGMTKPPFAWTCPFCGHDSVVTESNLHRQTTILTKDNKHGQRAAIISFIVCPNPECKEFTLIVSLTKTQLSSDIAEILEPVVMIKEWKLIPPSEAKVFPDYVPKSIRNDYEEAYLIRDLSPKASATLARRCLQGMIRDFWIITRQTLKQEIEAIKDKVDSSTWDAIDAVREIGNIGAHMEQDINLIIEVEPDEANLLINLVELLIKDWYITRHERKERLESIKKLGSSKKAQKKKNTNSPTRILLPNEEQGK